MTGTQEIFPLGDPAHAAAQVGANIRHGNETFRALETGGWGKNYPGQEDIAHRESLSTDSGSGFSGLDGR